MPLQDHSTTLGAACEAALARMRLDLDQPLVRVDGAVRGGLLPILMIDRENPGFSYDFEVRVADPLDALHWIAHLAEKTWVTKRHLEWLAILMHGQLRNAGGQGRG